MEYCYHTCKLFIDCVPHHQYCCSGHTADTLGHVCTLPLPLCSLFVSCRLVPWLLLPSISYLLISSMAFVWLRHTIWFTALGARSLSFLCIFSLLFVRLPFWSFFYFNSSAGFFMVSIVHYLPASIQCRPHHLYLSFLIPSHSTLRLPPIHLPSPAPLLTFS